MPLALVGLNYRTAPLSVREKVALANGAVQEALLRLAQNPHVQEAIILSTCHRTEICAVVTETTRGLKVLEDFLSPLGSDGLDRVLPQHLYRFTEVQVVQHILRVAAGLDSMILGEGQVLSQVREAVTAAQQVHTSRSILNTLFNIAVAAGKRTRAETFLARGAVSLSQAAGELAKKVLHPLSERKILVLGVGNVSEVAIRYLVRQGVGMVLIANRTYEKAVSLAATVGGVAIHLEEVGEKLSHVDGIISGSGSPTYLISYERMASALEKRKGGRLLLLVDLGVPRDIEPSVSKFENVFLYNVDDLQGMVQENLREREKEIPLVEKILAEEEAHFFVWLGGKISREIPLVSQ